MNSDTKIMSIIGIITVVVIIAGVMLAGSAQKSSTPAEISVKEEALIRDTSLKVTGANAKIQIVEFADFECPACAMLHTPLKRIKAEYGDKIDFVFRVIPIHGESSVLAASAAFAANEQGKFMEMHDVLFEKQAEWTKYGTKESDLPSLFETYAGQIGLDVEKYKADLKDKGRSYRETIALDAADASSMGINSTPTAIVNGKPLIRGVVSYDRLKEIIEAELNPPTAPVVTGVKVNEQ